MWLSFHLSCEFTAPIVDSTISYVNQSLGYQYNFHFKHFGLNKFFRLLVLTKTATKTQNQKETFF